jgi:cytochrome b561
MAMFAFGNYLVGLPFSPQKRKLMNWHKWEGVCILGLSVERLLWHLTHPDLALLVSMQAAMPVWQLWAHKATHVALYGLFFVVPLVAWAYSSAAGFPVVLFGQIALPDHLAPDKALAEIIQPWHEINALSMAFLVVLHVAAALKQETSHCMARPNP